MDDYDTGAWPIIGKKESMVMALQLNSANFENEVLRSEIPVLVDFWADWCGPCRMLAPVIEKMAREAEGYKVAKVNVDEEQDIAREYNIMSIPTVLVFIGGQVVGQSVGAVPEEKLKELLRTKIETYCPADLGTHSAPAQEDTKEPPRPSLI